jgi:hypothetical protein
MNQAGYFIQKHAAAARAERFGILVNSNESPILEVVGG